MKKFFLFFSALFIIVLLSITSCKKEDDMPVVNTDVEAVRAQLLAVSIPSKEEIQLILSEKPEAKSKSLSDDGNLGLMLVQIFALDQQTYMVGSETATKSLVYYEINQNGYRKKFLTIYQSFKVKDGRVDTVSYNIDYEVGCPFSRNFYLKNSNNISQLSYFFRFNNGNQFGYFGDMNYGLIKLPPIAEGKWQLEVKYDDGDMRQTFMTDLIDFYSKSNQLNLRLEVKTENTISVLEIGKNFIKGAYLLQFSGMDKSGNYVYMTYPVAFEENMASKIRYNVPFNIKDFVICGVNGCYGFAAKDAAYIMYQSDGTIIYGF